MHSPTQSKNVKKSSSESFESSDSSESSHMDLYAENILDHYHHPHHKGALASPTVTHEEKNVSCGDRLSVQLHITDNLNPAAAVPGRGIKEIAWTGEGCAISQAAMSMLSDELIGKSLEEIDTLTPETILALL